MWRYTNVPGCEFDGGDRDEFIRNRPDCEVETKKIFLQETGCATESIIFLSAHGMPKTANVSLSNIHAARLSISFVLEMLIVMAYYCRLCL